MILCKFMISWFRQIEFHFSADLVPTDKCVIYNHTLAIAPSTKLYKTKLNGPFAKGGHHA